MLCVCKFKNTFKHCLCVTLASSITNAIRTASKVYRDQIINLKVYERLQKIPRPKLLFCRDVVINGTAKVRQSCCFEVTTSDIEANRA